MGMGRPVGAVGIGVGAVLSSIPEGACACGAEGHMASIGPPALGAKGCIEGLHRFAQGKGLGRRLLKRRGAIMIKPLQPPLRAKENRQTALPAMEMHPYPRLRRYFPLRGKWWRQPPIGVHFHERSEVLRFSILRSRIIKLHRPQGDTTTLGPKGRQT